jgi:endonuclease/exonuclease/phosphatase (EEP) superfamily protein YafD
VKKALVALASLIVTFSAVAVSPAQAAPRDVTVTTANVLYKLSPAKAAADVQRASKGSDVVLTQEMGFRSAKTFRDTNWGAYQGTPTHGCKELITRWDKARFKVVRTKAVPIRNSGADMTDRCITVVTLEERETGERQAFVNIHFLPHVEVNGHPRPEMPGRTAAYGRAMTRLDQVLANVSPSLPVALGGDWNVDCMADRQVKSPIFPYAHLHDTMRAACIQEGTLGPYRHVDTLWFRGCRVLDQKIIIKTHSDHRFSRVDARCRQIPQE